MKIKNLKLVFLFGVISFLPGSLWALSVEKNISYRLNGKKISSEDLAGKSVSKQKGL